MRLQLALAYAHSAALRSASRELRRVLAEDPENGAAAINLAICYLDSGAPERAAALLAPYAEENPDEIMPVGLLAVSLASAGDREGARKAQSAVKEFLLKAERLVDEVEEILASGATRRTRRDDYIGPMSWARKTSARRPN